MVAVSALPVTFPVRLPKSDVAVTELMPDIFVALSPKIFPFAFISPLAIIFPAKVDTPDIFKFAKSDVAVVVLIKILVALTIPTILAPPRTSSDVVVSCAGSELRPTLSFLNLPLVYGANFILVECL